MRSISLAWTEDETLPRIVWLVLRMVIWQTFRTALTVSRWFLSSCFTRFTSEDVRRPRFPFDSVRTSADVGPGKPSNPPLSRPVCRTRL